MRGKQSARLPDKRINGRPKNLPKGNIRPVRIKADPPQYPAASRRRLHELLQSHRTSFQTALGHIEAV